MNKQMLKSYLAELRFILPNAKYEGQNGNIFIYLQNCENWVIQVKFREVTIDGTIQLPVHHSIHYWKNPPPLVPNIYIQQTNCKRRKKGISSGHDVNKEQRYQTHRSPKRHDKINYTQSYTKHLNNVVKQILYKKIIEILSTYSYSKH